MAKSQVARRKTPRFKYTDLVTADVKKCEDAVERIAEYQRRMASDVVAIGCLLLEVKEKLEHGQFGVWIKHYFGWSASTAKSMMQAAEVFGETPNFGDLTIDTSAIYLLASDRCPDELREEVLERAEKGERITHAAVKDALDGFGSEDDDEPAPPPKPVTRSTVYVEDDPVEEEEPPPAQREVSTRQAVVNDATTQELIEWSLGDFVSAMHREVGMWRQRCPEDQLEEMVEVLRDMAEQIEEQMK